MSAYEGGFHNGRLWVLGPNTAAMEVCKLLIDSAGEASIQPRRNVGDNRYTLGDLKLLHHQIAKSSTQRPINRGLKVIMFVRCAPLNIEGVAMKMITHDWIVSRGLAPVAQVLEILQLRVSSQLRRWVELNAANDCGSYAGMEAVGATLEEMHRVRAFASKVLGVTPAEAADAVCEADNAEAYKNLRVVRLIGHNQCTPVIDRFHTKGLLANNNILIIGNGSSQASFFGDGALCLRLHREFGGWAGGSGCGMAGDMRASWGQSWTQKGDVPVGRILMTVNQK